MVNGSRKGFGRVYHENGKLLYAGNWKGVPYSNLIFIYDSSGAVKYIGPTKFIPACDYL